MNGGTDIARGSQSEALLKDFPHLVPLHEELVAAWKGAEALRFDDPFAGRGLIRLGKALVAFHEAVKGCRADA